MNGLKVPPEEAIRLLSERADEITLMCRNRASFEYYEFVGWCTKLYALIDSIYEATDMHPEDIRLIGLPGCSCSTCDSTNMLLEVYHSRLLDYIREIGQ